MINVDIYKKIVRTYKHYKFKIQQRKSNRPERVHEMHGDGGNP